MTKIKTLLLCLALALPAWTTADELPDTGISGVYEVMVGTDKAQALIEYFGEFGFGVVDEASLSAAEAEMLYGVNSALKSYRLQNGDIDSHGLLRIFEWDELQGPGVGYAPPETVGQRMAVMRTRDIFRLDDVFTDLRDVAGQPWLPAGPVFDDLYDMDEGEISIHKRRVGVREMGVWGQTSTTSSSSATATAFPVTAPSATTAHCKPASSPTTISSSTATWPRSPPITAMCLGSKRKTTR